MIEISKTNVMNWEAAIRGMRNPMNSWDKSDSCLCKGADGFEDCTVNGCGECPRHEDFSHDIYCVGGNDLALMKKLAKAGSDHRKFMRQIFVSVDIKAPLYWWKEFDTYKVGTVANSCSTMHKIHEKEFTREDFSFERTHVGWSWFIDSILNVLNTAREQFLKTKDKSYWEDMIQFLPSSYNQLRTVTMNYENLVNIYHARKNHKLDEWHVLCDWIERLPYSEIIIGE